MEPATTLAALLGTLREEHAEEPETRVSAVVGQVTTSDWCEGACAQVFIRLDNLYRSGQQFPNPDPATGSTGASWAAVWHIGVWRCVHVVDGRGNPPTPEEQTEDAVQIIEDTCKLRAAVQAYVDQLTASKGAYHLGRWSPMGPFGTCTGGYWTLTTKLGRLGKTGG